MAYQSVFKRYEIKYLITNEQKSRLLEATRHYMALDKYGRTLIRNIYFDTDNYRLIRRSIEKPDYKEKLRVRSYGTPSVHVPVFAELKKKYEHVVYKRRISLPYGEAMSWLTGDESCPFDTQITREMDYFKNYYAKLYPTVHLSYEREAYYEIGGELRVTFDDNILAREEDVSLSSPIGGESVLDEGYNIMEIKCSGGIPLWMVRALSKEKIYKSSYSKYGEAYKRLIFPRLYSGKYGMMREDF